MSSASRPSEAAVKPTRSAKSTETRRRSACGCAASDPVGGDAGAQSAVPHSPQNFAAGAFGVAQLGQVTASGDPHSPQNFRPASFSWPQTPHFTSATASLSRIGRRTTSL